jgi:iron complex outermembrane receptor protein
MKPPLLAPARAGASAHAASAAALLLLAAPVAAAETRLEEVVVTAARMSAPLLVVTDPKQPRQPLPAHDGADYLKTVPGFSVIRKGGTDGDPVFRGMAASRLNITVDGQQTLGGCGMRMDPPTAYVFPEAYDRIVVVKGPQTVLDGPGSSAATVRFEREPPQFETRDATGSASALAGGFGRRDLLADLRAGTPTWYGQATGTWAHSDDYSDGDGERVHSRYERWSANAALGWTPSRSSRLELSGALSDGEAAYADRSMDGIEFRRENAGLRFEREGTGGRVAHLEALAYYNYVDHVMDNYRLRDFVPTASMPYPAVSNPDRRTTGGKLAATLQLTPALALTTGVDLQQNRHTLRSTMNETLRPYEALDRVEDARFENAGLFGEATWTVRPGRRVVAGLRVDDWQAEDARRTLALGMASVPNPTAGAERHETLPSGFARYEHELGASSDTTLYAGLGHVERFPDYWELVSAGKESVDSLSAFGTRPEQTTQLDLGVVHATDRFEFALSAWYASIDDYILIESKYPKGMRLTTVTRNVEATTWGLEADTTYALTPTLRVTGTLASARGRNDTDERPLAQMPPLEARLGVDWTRGPWALGALWRVVAEQDRYAVGQGNVVGQDLGRTPGFGVFSFNGGWTSRRGVRVTAGVDNLFDRTYAEHLSRSGAMVAGYEQTTRVNEPGRTLWLKAAVDY